MKKALALLLSLVMLISLTPFQGAIMTNANAVESEDFDISVFWYDFNDAYLSAVRAALNEELGEAGFNYADYDAASSQAIQNEQIESAITRGTDLLIVNIVDQSDGAGEAIVAMARAAEIPVIFFNREVFGNYVFNSYKEACYVGSDYRDAGVAQGTMAGEYFVKNYDAIDLNGDGKISYIMMSGEIANPEASSRTELSIEYANDILEDAGKPELVYYDANNTNRYQVANWSWDTAAELMESALKTNPMTGNAPIEAIFANNDDMALGCIDALTEVGWNTGDGDSIPVFGLDCAVYAEEAIAEGKLTGTVRQPRESIAYTIMDMVYNVANDLPVFDGIADDYNVDEGVAKVRVAYEIVTNEPEEEYIMGDVDANSVINTADLVLMARYIVDLVETMPNEDSGDLNGDGVITNADLIELARMIVNID